MNKKGFTYFLALMLGIVCFVLAYGLAKPTVQVATESMTQLNCSDSSVTNYNKAICAQIDIFAPLMVGLLFGLAGALIGGFLG